MFSEQYQEHFHTKSGAIEETFKKHAEPAQVKDGFKILDICFGIGYNTLAALHLAKNLKVVALENDRKVLKQMQEIQAPEYAEYEKVKMAAKNLHYKNENFEINIILGDARETIKQAGTNFDAVFLDPFSPQTCPELWTVEFMVDICKVMKKNAILTTYSYARKVRDNLAAAGFDVRDGPIVGRRSPSTIAVKK